MVTKISGNYSQVDHNGTPVKRRKIGHLEHWSFVFIPYCTGDIHWGANDQEYTLETTFDGQPVTVTRTIQHRGFVNWQVVLKWITENIEKPHKIFVTGSSAGSYGALSGFPWIKEGFSKSAGFPSGRRWNGCFTAGV